MPQFRAAQHVVEHPALLFDFLQTRGVTIRVMDGARATGQECGVDFRFEVRPKRFQANLFLLVFVPKASTPSELTEQFLNEVTTNLNAADTLSDRISCILTDFGIPRCDSSIEDELEAALSSCAENQSVHNIVAAIREQQELVRSYVADQNFELAAHHRDKREQLLDSLYDQCVLGKTA